jgi:2-keto-4-pentenoate hydratase/2-oxohepta-3-ene-1,7-dioic acid hydratase in catechol pathway
MQYSHRFDDGAALDLPLGKVVCVGRNYAEHAKELNNPIPAEPILFIKPATAVRPFAETIRVPQGRGECHFETEIAVLIGETLTQASPETAVKAIAGFGVGLDLTLRDLQAKLKEKGHPWEVAKSWDGACPLSPFVRAETVSDLDDIGVRLTVNGQIRQDGNSKQMLTSIGQLLSFISQHFTLQPGDVVLTGTPAGVGPLQPGDQVQAELVGLLTIATSAI